MNVISFALAIAAIIVFLGAWRGEAWSRLGLGLGLLTTAWVIQVVWVTTSTVSIN